MNTVGLLQVVLAKLFEALKSYASQKFFGADEEQQFLDRIMAPIKKDLRLLRKEIQDKHLTAEDLDLAISEAILNENELGSDLFRGTKTYKLLNDIQTELTDVLHVENVDQLTESVFSNRLKKGLQKIRKNSPDLLTPENISGAFDFIVEKAVKNESYKKFDYKNLLASIEASPEKKPEDDPYLSYLNYKPVPPSQFDARGHRFPNRSVFPEEPEAPKSPETNTHDTALPSRMQTYDKLLSDLKVFKEELTSQRAKLYKDIEAGMDEQVARLQKAMAAPRTALPEIPSLLGEDSLTVPSFTSGNRPTNLPTPEIEQALPYARL